MNKLVSIFCLAATILAVALPARPEQVHHYLLLDPGNEKWLQHFGGPDHLMLLRIDGEYQGLSVRHEERWAEGVLYETWDTLLDMDATGDVWWYGRMDGQYEPPVLLLDYPLYVGKTWESWTTRPDGTQLHFVTTIDASEIVTVPYGTFPCLRVVQEMHGPGYDYDRRFWLHDGAGIVRITTFLGHPFQLTTATIPIDPRSWSRIKALYR